MACIRNIKKYIGMALALPALCAMLHSCNEGSVGNTISQSAISVQIDSAFTVTGITVATPQITPRTTQQLLGVIKADNYGILQSDFVTQFMPAFNLDTVGVTADCIDSVKYFMRIPPMGFSGDSLVPMRTSVYKLSKQLPANITSNFDPAAEGYYSQDDLLGTIAYSATALGMTDSMYSDVYERQVAVKLPREWGKNFFNRYITNPETFSSPTEFAKWFPGIYVANSYGSGRVMHIQSSVVTFYYRKNVKNSEDRDTTYYLQSDYLATTPEVRNNNNIRLQIAQSVQDRVAAGEVILQAPAGLDAQISVPVRDMMRKYYTAKGSNLGVVNNVYMSIPAETINNDSQIAPPPAVLLVKASEKEKFFKENKITDDVSSFYAVYDSSTKKYVFSELRSYFIDLISKHDPDHKLTADQLVAKITDEDCEFAIVPVLVVVDSDYYGSTYVVDVKPYVDAPAICKLNLDKVRLVMAYSIQQLVQQQ